jgi:hypothetical protein
VADAAGRVALRELDGGTSLDVDVERLRGRSVLISSDRQLPAVLALAELDGIARRLVLCPPDVAAEHMAAVMAEAEIDAIVTDGSGPAVRRSATPGRTTTGRRRRSGCCSPPAPPGGRNSSSTRCLA